MKYLLIDQPSGAIWSKEVGNRDVAHPEVDWPGGSSKESCPPSSTSRWQRGCWCRTSNIRALSAAEPEGARLYAPRHGGSAGAGAAGPAQGTCLSIPGSIIQTTLNRDQRRLSDCVAICKEVESFHTGASGFGFVEREIFIGRILNLSRENSLSLGENSGFFHTCFFSSQWCQPKVIKRMQNSAPLRLKSLCVSCVF